MSLFLEPGSLKDNDWSVRRSYWVLREVIKKVPEKHLKGGDNNYLLEQITDTLKSLAETITRNWEENTKEIRAREKMPAYGDLMPTADWLACVESSGFIDYDGHGNLSDGTELSDIEIKPSDITVFKLKIPSWATHVMWFNK